MNFLIRAVGWATTTLHHPGVPSAGGSRKDDSTFMVTAGTVDAPKRAAPAYIQVNDLASTRRRCAIEGIPDDPVPPTLRCLVDASHALGGAVTDRLRDGRTAETAR
jgi:hypothetical protein